MNKQEFLERLRMELSGLPQDDIEERLTFYGEMIDDRMEEGLSEEDAVNGIGSMDDIIAQTVADIPLTRLVRERIRPKSKLRVWEIVLLVLGSPLWLSLLIAAFAVVFALYASLWSVIVSLWAVFAALVCSVPAGIVSGIIFAVKGSVVSGIAAIGAGIVCAGLSILAFFGCMAATKGVCLLTKKVAIGIKNLFVKKEQ